MPEGDDRAGELLGRLREQAPGEGHSLTLISASFEDGTALAVVAARAEDAIGHDEDGVKALLATPEGEVTEMDEVLLSTEYGPDGGVRRIGLELYEDADGVPLRIAANREGERMEFRLEGRRGVGVHEVVVAG